MSEGDYDPHEHRKERLAHPTNNLETFVHLIKGCLGTGVLAMPEAYKFSGMYGGMVGMAILAFFATYCVHVLIRCQYELCKKKQTGLLTYAETVEAACEVGPPCFGNLKKIAPHVTDFFLIFYQIGVCCVYYVFVATNLKYIFDELTDESPLYVYMLALFLPHCLIVCIRNLKYLAPFSMAANVVTFVTFGVAFYYIFEGLEAEFSERTSLGRVVDWPLFLGTVMFALQSLPTTLAVENNMKNPEYFRKTYGVLNLGYCLLAIMYLFVGIFGYWRYGEGIKSSITLNFPPTDVLAQVIILSYSTSIYVTFGLNVYVVVTIINDSYLASSLEEASDIKKLCVEMVLRFVIVLVTCILSISIPLLGVILSLCGSFCLSALGIIFPGLLEICVYWQDGRSRPNTFRFWKDIVIIVLGIVALLSGLYGSIYAMYEQLSESSVFD